MDIRIKRLLLASTTLLTLVGNATYADTTPKGKIIKTEGHHLPDCRRVTFKENGTGLITQFRIRDVDGNDDVQAIVLTALTTKSDARISFSPGNTTGCGGEPAINWIEISTE